MLTNKYDLSWREKLSIAWDVFLTITAWAGVIFFSLSALFGIGAFLYFLFSGKLI
jgi:hypothetical protein